jgi:SAM-dependent methyltransferase
LDPSSKAASAAETPGETASPGSQSHSYNDIFYDYINAGAIRSASIVVPLVLRELSPASVIDVGCGVGAWLSEYREFGVADYLGVDGAYVQVKSLLIPAEHFQGRDVAQPFDLGRRFDLVQCLEVAEHLPKTSSDILIDNLTRHGDRVLFSAATPGQGGEFHINEQTHEYWRALFAKRGYKPFDLFRPMIKDAAAVESWYRRNIVLYVAEAAIPALPPAVRGSGIPDDRKIPVLNSLAYSIQARVVSLLPVWLVTRIALAKHHIAITSRSLKGN